MGPCPVFIIASTARTTTTTIYSSTITTIMCDSTTVSIICLCDMGIWGFALEGLSFRVPVPSLQQQVPTLQPCMQKLVLCSGFTVAALGQCSMRLHSKFRATASSLKKPVATADFTGFNPKERTLQSAYLQKSLPRPPLPIPKFHYHLTALISAHIVGANDGILWAMATEPITSDT